jgi:hypothetical protein
LPLSFVKKGELAEPLATLARYLELLEVTPEQVTNSPELQGRFFRNLKDAEVGA